MVLVEVLVIGVVMAVVAVMVGIEAAGEVGVSAYIPPAWPPSSRACLAGRTSTPPGTWQSDRATRRGEERSGAERLVGWLVAQMSRLQAYMY